MDKIGTRSGNRSDLAQEESWTVKLATEVAHKHREQSLLCVTFKNDEERLREILDREHGHGDEGGAAMSNVAEFSNKLPAATPSVGILHDLAVGVPSVSSAELTSGTLTNILRQATPATKAAAEFPRGGKVW